MIDVLAIGAAVTLATEVVKSLMPEPQKTRLAPYLALCIAALVTVLYTASQPSLPGRTDIWPLAQDVIEVFAVATGVYKGARLARP